MSVTSAIVAMGGITALLIMALLVVGIARALDGAMAARAGRAREKAAARLGAVGVGDVLKRLRAARGGGASAAESAKTAAQAGAARGAARTFAVIAGVIAFVGGIAAAFDNDKGAAPVSSEITAGSLHGTLLAVGKSKRVVLIVPGSGPTDRNGDNPMGVRAASYRLLAEGLAGEGVASVRIDKRGMFASQEAGDPNAVTIRVYADDIHAWIDATLAATHAKCVWLLGHSEGAMMVAAAAEGRKDVCGLILVSGQGRRLGDVLRTQLKANPANAPVLEQAFSAIAELEAGRHVDVATLHPGLRGLFNAPAQDFLISEIGVDPVDLLRRAKKKTLIVQGASDLQITLEDADLLNAAPSTTLALIAGMNHVLKLAPSDRAGNIATYSDPSLPLAPKLVDRIASFIKDDD
jgi:pimeloyl-ACP methyl ester carboxylesterase